MESLQPKLRFSGFNGDWEIKKLGEISNKVMYGMNSAATEYDGKNKYLRITDIDDDSRTFIPKPLVTPDGKIEEKYKLKDGDIVFTRTGASVGKTYLYNSKDGNLLFAGFLIKFSIIKGNPYFVFSQTLLESYNKWVLKMSMRSGQPGLNAEECKDLDVFFPTISEQTKIANFLSSVDAKINQLTKKKALLEKYKKGVMQKIFNQEIKFKDDEGMNYSKWKSSKIGKISKIYDGTHQTPNYVDKGIPFYSVEHVSANQFETTRFISEEVFEKENKRVKLEKGDILMTRIGSIGVAKYINWDVKASFYVSLALIKQSDKINNEYLYHFINTDYFQTELWKRTIHVAFPQKINLGEISECLIKIPVLEEQTKIAKFLSAIDDKINQVVIQLDKTKEFKKGLLQQMFI